MSTSRPKLKLDEQSFQDMLAAAFTIQEHNTKRKRTPPPEHVCEQCGVRARDGERLCVECAAEEQRPGEQLQRKWASMWLMSQDQGLWDHPSNSPDDTPGETIPAETEATRVPVAFEVPDQPHQTAALGDSRRAPDLADPFEEDQEEEQEEEVGPATEELEYEPSDSRLAKFSPVPRIQEVTGEVELTSPDMSAEEPIAAPWNLRDLRLRLRFHRADLYLVVAIVVSTFAMVWVLSATPAGAAQRKPRLSAWEKALVSLGLADPPEPAPRRGNPNIQVWVDPKTALYYCVGEDLYGKAPGGHATTQREAQMDQYEPASRAGCE
jgi:hypothetical protein